MKGGIIVDKLELYQDLIKTLAGEGKRWKTLELLLQDSRKTVKNDSEEEGLPG